MWLFGQDNGLLEHVLVVVILALGKVFNEVILVVILRLLAAEEEALFCFFMGLISSFFLPRPA